MSAGRPVGGHATLTAMILNPFRLADRLSPDDREAALAVCHVLEAVIIGILAGITIADWTRTCL